MPSILLLGLLGNVASNLDLKAGLIFLFSNVKFYLEATEVIKYHIRLPTSCTHDIINFGKN